jgi:mannose/fructose/N-acetylgalactosamine-specific phosphotransferase system component IIC
MSQNTVQRAPELVATGWRPTRKWVVGQVTALGALVTMFVTTGGWDQEETIALVGLAVAAATSYLVPNLDAPGGVHGRV